jgi:Flp pilus assembly protein TadG
MKAGARERCLVSADSRGGVVVEFALIAPLALALQIGTIYVALLAFSQCAMEYAVAQGARCAAVATSLCAGATSIMNYATTQYLGVGSPSFVWQAASCGNLVSATMSPSWTAVLANYTTQLSASACFPSQ